MSTTSKMPKGIPYIIGNEAAERFSYYGMKTILLVFMTDYLMMSENTGTLWIHTFGIGVYFFPLIGALLADIFLGKYKTIMSLSIVYCIGHLVLALFETSMGLAAGLTLIAIGSGGIKPCVSAHVGDQFDNSNKHLIERIFSYFYLSINMGAFISTLATPLLLRYYGPSVAFGIPGVLMLIATFLFWIGRKKFIAIRPFGKEFAQELTKKDILKTIGNLLVIYLFVAVFWSLFDQTASTWVIQAKSSMMIKNFMLFGQEYSLLPSQIQAANPILVLIFVPLFTFIIYPLVGKFVKVTPLRKITFGMLIAVVSFLVVGWIEGRIQQGIATHINWQFFAYIILTAAEVMVSITALEFSYTQAPNKMKSVIMGLFWFSVSFGNVITTVVNKFILVSFSVLSFSPGNQTYIETAQIEDFEDGYKIEIKETMDYYQIVDRINPKTSVRYLDTVKLEGTFVVQNIDQTSNQFEIVNPTDRSSIKTIFKQDIAMKQKSVAVFNYKLQGASYFNFFAFMMLGAAMIFMIVAYFYKGKVYIQSKEDLE